MPSMDPDRRARAGAAGGRPAQSDQPAVRDAASIRVAAMRRPAARRRSRGWPPPDDGDHRARLPHADPGSGHSSAPPGSGVRRPRHERGTREPQSRGAHAAEPLVTCEDLTVRFVGREGTVHAVNGVNFDARRGRGARHPRRVRFGQERHTARPDAACCPPGATQIERQGYASPDKDVMALDRQARLGRSARRTVAMIFQEPMTAFDPVYTVGDTDRGDMIRHEGLLASATPGRARSSCSRWCRSPRRRGGSTTIPTRCRAACASAP